MITVLSPTQPSRRKHYVPEPRGNFHMTERAKLILALLDSYRLLRSSHILELLRHHLGEISEQQTLRLLRDLLDHKHVLRIVNDPASATVIHGSLRKIYGRNTRRNLALNERYDKMTKVAPHTLEVADSVILNVLRPCLATHGQVRFIDTPEIISSSPERTRKLIKPLTWKVKAYFQGKEVNLSSTPDRLFGVRLNYRQGPNEWFFVLEEDRSSETVLPKNLIKATIFRKALCYCFAWHHKLPEQMYNIRHFRVIFVTDSKKRVEHMIEVFNLANRELKEYQKREGLKPDGCPPNVFLFIDRPTLRAGNIFTAPWLNGKGEVKKIELPQS